MEFSVTQATADKKRTNAIVVGVYDGRRLSESGKRLDDASGGELKKLLRASNLEGGIGQSLLVGAVSGTLASSVVLVGLGKTRELSATKFQKVLGTALTRVKECGARDVTLYLTEVQVDDRDAYWNARAGALAVHEATYKFDQMKSHQDDKPKFAKIAFYAHGKRENAAVEQGLRDGDALGAGIALTRDLGNLPANVCTPSYLANEARKLARSAKSLSVQVKSEADMKRMRMDSLLSVSQGSEEPAKLIVFEYHGAKKTDKPIALVGKGVTFDTGGISLKPSAAMDEMKFDMCGAASVFGTVKAVAAMKLPINVVGVVPATENMPSGRATKPGDIFTSMSGQTIEVLNTDAEGRLILCDALTYVARYKPDVVIDIATLTGACVVALGAHASGLFSNHGPLARALLESGDYAGDRAWEMPVWDEYAEQLRSNFADVANIGGREAGAITAAAFLGKFTGDYRWAHLDIAGTAWKSGKAKGATGRPVKLLTQYILDRAGKKRRR